MTHTLAHDDPLIEMVSDYLFRLSNVIGHVIGQPSVPGGGGVGGYGKHFANEVFEMHPYFWPASFCGRCIDHEARARMLEDLVRQDLANPNNIATEEQLRYRYDNLLDEACLARGSDPLEVCYVPSLVRPTPWCTTFNFRTRSGLIVWWYKYIGRGTAILAPVPITKAYLLAEFKKCFKSLGVKFPAPEELVGEQGASQENVTRKALKRASGLRREVHRIRVGPGPGLFVELDDEDEDNGHTLHGVRR